MKKSFTLIELIVVIAIIAILAAIIAPNAFRAIEKAKVAQVVSDLKTFKTAAVGYYGDTGQWPPDGVSWFTDEELQFFITGVGQPAGWDGPYLESWPNPPWHCEFVYGADTVHENYDWDHWVGWSYWGVVPANTDTCGASISCVPQKSATKIDVSLDDGNPSSGRVRWVSSYAGGFMNAIIIEGGQ
ncbi:MAG: type II secretion system protein GspG [Candidatus Omnitrophica bacterium]|nr:type II secretion system protein GspG [Candidatus Omnitrophota bacterium]